MDQDLEKQHQEKTKVKNIQSVEMGRYEARFCPPPASTLCMSLRCTLPASSTLSSSTACM